MKKYKQPRITISKKDCICSYCDGKIKKGDEVYIIPNKAVYHIKCYNMRNSTRDTIEDHYSRVLTDEEIKSIFNNSKPLTNI